MREGHLTPVLFTSAKTGAAIGELVDVIVKLLPNPAEGNPPVYQNVPAGGAEPADPTPRPAPDGPALAHGFKRKSVPSPGRLAGFQTHQGPIPPGTRSSTAEGRNPVN